MKPADKKKDEGNYSNSRTGWAPMLVRVGENFSLVLLWKNRRKYTKLYALSNAKDSIFGKLLSCRFSNGCFDFTDDLDQTATTRFEPPQWQK